VRRLALVLALVACRGSASKTGDTETFTRSTAFLEDEYQPTYEKPELQRVLAAERAAIATAELRPSALDGDAEHAAQQDLAVRRRFVASLEACEANGRVCPPRLDEPAWRYDVDEDADPPLDATLRFDLASWQKIAAELHGRACACRTHVCTESLGAAIDRLEPRPMPEVQADDTALLSIVRARECLDRLRGRRPTPRVYAVDDSASR
jgi:hypothetical protein